MARSACYECGVRPAAVFLAVFAFGACGDNLDRGAFALSYDWDGRPVVCSQPIDDMTTPENWPRIEDELRLARDYQWVAIMHAHIVGQTIQRATLERVLNIAEENGLDFLTFRDLAEDKMRRAGLALAFDDNAPDAWVTMREALNAHGARVTFFVARWNEMTAPQHAEIVELAHDGHDIEPHTVNHLHGPDYVAQNGMDAYLNDEVLPSFQVLVDAGFQPAHAFAYPFGEHTAEMDAALLQVVDRVRTTPGECPKWP
jgi:hypothetical protein